jgi:DNA-binding winged helix-turn-helix (wHTH) protein/tetratricopeptide (TPR) repeat protein
MIHRFAQCELDDERFELTRRGKPVKLEPKVFDVMLYLLRHPDRVVTKSELLDEVWAGVNVSESVLPKCIAAARRAVGDTRAQPTVIRTVHGRGYRLIAAVQAGGPETAADIPRLTSHPFPSDPSFVGRGDLLTHLHAALAEAMAGRGRTIVLLGEPGIGKTRTAETLADAARRRSIAVLTGRAYESDTAPAFWPWVQILRGLTKLPAIAGRLTAAGPIPAEVLALVPELEPRQPARRPPESEAARFRLFDGVATILKHAAAQLPVVLLLDDIQWADAASLHLLGLLASETADAALLVIATCRDAESERTPPVAELLERLARLPACERITLGGLVRSDTDALVSHLLATPPPPAVLETIHSMTAGNPFFVREIVRVFASDGARAVRDVADMSQPLPRRVREAIRRRLGDLSAECRALLRIAAVLGQEFETIALGAVAESAPARVLQLLGEARAQDLLDAVGDAPARYAFHHALFRHALYDELDDAERVHWHGRAGEQLERRADADANLDAIAQHYLVAAASGAVERAIAACVRAAEQAERLFAYERSAGLYERALALMASTPSGDEARRVELVLALGEVRSAAGEREPARAVFAEAAALARRLGRVDLLARAALGYRGPAEMGSPSDAPTLALLDEALTATGGTFPVLRARLLSRLVGTPPHSDSMATRARLSAEALALAHPSRDPVAMRDALSARLWASIGPDAIDERLAVGRELLALAEREQSLALTMLAHDAAIGAHLLRGDLDAAARALVAYGEVATVVKRPALRFLATFWTGSLALARGELDVAERSFQAAMALGRGTVPYAHFMFAGQMYPLRYLRGEEEDPELAGVFFGEMMALPYAFEPAIRSALAFANCLRGQHAAARGEFEYLMARAERGLERDEHWLVTVGGLARLAVVLGDAPRAAWLSDLLRPYADLVLVHDMLRAVGEPVTATLGHLATACGQLDAAARYYERAIAKATAMHARVAAIDIHVGYARMLTARGSRGDRRRAAGLQDQATRAMAALGIRRNWILDACPG